MFVCVDDGSRMTRSTIMETSYTQKFDSQSFVSVSTVNFKNFQPSVNLILNISSFTFLLFFFVRLSRFRGDHADQVLQLLLIFLQHKQEDRKVS